MLTHRVGYNPHLHIAKNLIALVEAFRPPRQVPYTKTVIGDDQLEVAIPPAPAGAGKMLARIRAESRSIPRASGWCWSIRTPAKCCRTGAGWRIAMPG